MKAIFFIWVILCSIWLHAAFDATVSRIDTDIKIRMIKGNSWRRGCPVPLEDLRYLTLMHWDFRGEQKQGEIVVHKDVASNVVSIFRGLYGMKYPIRQMRLVSDFGGSDWRSIEADNTSAFNCRKATGSKRWSKHSYGRAIDINPIENPYISRTGRISHKESLAYRKRVHQKSTYADKVILLKNDKAVKIFKKYGWKWGGDFRNIKDYQHFAK
jgi:hypothetical protein